MAKVEVTSVGKNVRRDLFEERSMPGQEAPLFLGSKYGGFTDRLVILIRGEGSDREKRFIDAKSYIEGLIMPLVRVKEAITVGPGGDIDAPDFYVAYEQVAQGDGTPNQVINTDYTMIMQNGEYAQGVYDGETRLTEGSGYEETSATVTISNATTNLITLSYNTLGRYRIDTMTYDLRPMNASQLVHITVRGGYSN